MTRGRRRDLDTLIRQEREQFKANLNDEQKKISRGFDKVDQARKERKVHSTTNHYLKYEKKLSAGEYDKFTSRDLLFFFKDVARKNGITIYSNLQLDIRYMNNIKLALKNFSIEELMVMMDFLFTSDQPYLEKETLQPGILVTGWASRIYKDSKDWQEGRYTPKEIQKSKKTELEKFKKNREWEEEVKCDVDTSLVKRRLNKKIKQLQEEHKQNNGWG